MEPPSLEMPQTQLDVALGFPIQIMPKCVVGPGGLQRPLPTPAIVEGKGGEEIKPVCLCGKVRTSPCPEDGQEIP